MNSPIIDFSAIENAQVEHSPYPFFGVEHAFYTDSHQALLETFPAIESGGSLPLDSVPVAGAFAHLIEEIKSDRFRQVMAKKFDVQLQAK